MSFSAAGPTTTQALTSCITIAKRTFDVFNIIDATHLHDFSMVQWWGFNHMIIFAFQLVSFALAHSPVDDVTFRSLSQVKDELKSICTRMGQLTKNIPGAKGLPDTFSLLQSVLIVVQNKYSTMIDKLLASPSPIDPARPANSDSIAAFCPVISGAIKRTEYWDSFTFMSGGTPNLESSTWNEPTGSLQSPELDSSIDWNSTTGLESNSLDSNPSSGSWLNGWF
jgi:hypothetical protein